jgi:hypothetical protein
MKCVLLGIANSSFVGHKSGEVPGSKEQQIVLKMFTYTKIKNTGKKISWTVSETAEVMYFHFFMQDTKFTTFS